MTNQNIKNLIRRIIKEEINSEFDRETNSLKMKMYLDTVTLEKMTKNKVKVHRKVTATNMGTEDNPLMSVSTILLIGGEKYLMLRGDEPNTYEIMKFSKLSADPDTFSQISTMPDFYGSVRKIAAQINKKYV
jgi:hypothetical protein